MVCSRQLQEGTRSKTLQGRWLSLPQLGFFLGFGLGFFRFTQRLIRKFSTKPLLQEGTRSKTLQGR